MSEISEQKNSAPCNEAEQPAEAAAEDTEMVANNVKAPNASNETLSSKAIEQSSPKNENKKTPVSI